MPKVVTVGETMVLATPTQPGRLRHSSSLELKIGGAESNLAIALSRLGLSVGWVSYLGADEPGQLVLDRVRGEGVGTEQVRRLQGYTTGLYLRERLSGEVRVYYYRRGSAASLMEPGAFDLEYLEGARFLHLTGITPALSTECQAFTRWAMQEARRSGVSVSFDVNYRSKLWSATEARDFIKEMLSSVDLLFISAEEARALWDRDDENFAEELAEMGPHEVVLKHGEKGSVVWCDGRLLAQPAFPVPEVDPIGAGDAFAAGYLAGHLWELEPTERLRTATAMGAYSVRTLGDYEGLPSKEELRAFLEGKSEMGR